jgi:Protein of unknown function (DUF2690)
MKPLKANARRLFLALPITLALAVVLSVTALAQPWDGSDPNATGCANTGVTQFATNIDQGQLQFRYSTACQTTWARFICLSSSCTNYDIMVQRQQDGLTYVNGVRWPSSTPNGGTLYTPQLFDGAGWSAIVCYRAAFNGWTWSCLGPW